MSLQVGPFCYATQAAAAGAACASFMPSVSTYSTAGTVKVVSLSCAGVSGGAMQMRTDIASSSPPTGGSVTWTISALPEYPPAVGSVKSYGADPAGFCAASAVDFSSGYVVFSCDAAAGVAHIVAQVVADGSVLHVTYTQDVVAGPPGTTTTSTTVDVTPSFGDCVWPDFVGAGELIASAALVAWIGWYGIKKVNDLVNSGRGNHGE